MATAVSCIIPPSVDTYLRDTYKQPAHSIVVYAAKTYLNARTSADASIEASIIARKRGVTKTDIYREALIAMDKNVESIWATPPSSRSGASQRAKKLMASTPEATQQIANIHTINTTLEALIDNIHTLSSRKLIDQLRTILAKSRQLETSMAEELKDRYAV